MHLRRHFKDLNPIFQFRPTSRLGAFWVMGSGKRKRHTTRFLEKISLTNSQLEPLEFPPSQTSIADSGIDDQVRP